MLDMKKTIITIAVIAVVGLGIYFIVSKPTPAIPVSNTSTSAASENIMVSIKNFSFNPPALTVKTGAKVTWVNNDSVSHTVTSDSGNLLDSKTISPGQSFSFIFGDIGSANYHCAIHPMMKGSIVVGN